MTFVIIEGGISYVPSRYTVAAKFGVLSSSSWVIASTRSGEHNLLRYLVSIKFYWVPDDINGDSFILRVSYAISLAIGLSVS